MQTHFTSVPFKIDDNFSQVAGVAKFSRAGIVLEFESKLFGLIKSGVKEVRIPLDEILDVKFRKGVFKRGAKIEIRLKSFTKMSEIPNSEGKIVLKLVRDDFERGEQAVSALQTNLSEHQESLAPPQMPVSRLFEEESEETDKLEN